MKQIMLMVAVILLVAGSAAAQDKGWEVPAKAKAMKPTENLADKSVIADGKAVWYKHCKACHGSKGLGDGPKGAMLKADPGDFSSTKFQAQSDGTLYYKTITGKGEMPAYAKKITNEDDRWALVAYMRSLKK